MTFDLRKRLVIGFTIMICAAFSVSVLCIYEIGSDSFYRQISDNTTSRPPENEKHHADASRVVPVLKRLQYRMTIITLCIFVSLCGIFFIFIQSLIHPLNEMIKVTRRMADVHLNETVTVRSDDEIGRIGENINDPGINVQEILLHIWKHTGVSHLFQKIKVLRPAGTAENSVRLNSRRSPGNLLPG